MRVASHHDVDAILALMKRSLGTGSAPRDHAYWSWKHERSPFGASDVLLAEVGTELVGLRVFMRWSWVSGARRFRAVRAVDTATHPDWQGRGIFKKLTLTLADRLRAEGLDLVFNTPNAFSRPGYLKMGWSSLGRTSLWIKPLRPARLAAAALRGGRAHAPEPCGVAGGSVGDLMDRPGMPGFLDGVHADEVRLHTPRSIAYLKWRYAHVPGFDYRAAGDVTGDEGAVVIYRTSLKRGLRELRFCEVLVGPGGRSRATARHLIRRAVNENGADYAAAMGPVRTREGATLVSAGFVPAPHLGPVLTVRPLALSTVSPDPLARSAWRLAIGDLELF